MRSRNDVVSTVRARMYVRVVLQGLSCVCVARARMVLHVGTAIVAGNVCHFDTGQQPPCPDDHLF